VWCAIFFVVNDLNLIAQPLNPNVAVDSWSYFSLLNVDACTCMGPAFSLSRVKSSADKG
jgi:hypothetical protein